MPQDVCLICLAPTARTWSPPKECSCRPNLHRECWHEWALKNGCCVICRDQNQISQNPQPRNLQLIIYVQRHDQEIPNRIQVCKSYMSNLFLALLVLYLSLVLVTAFRHGRVGSVKDEL